MQQRNNYSPTAHLLAWEPLPLVLLRPPSAGAASAACTVLRLLAMPRCTNPYHAPPEIAIVRPRMASPDLASPMKMMLIATTTTWWRPGEGVRRGCAQVRAKGASISATDSGAPYSCW